MLSITPAGSVTSVTGLDKIFDRIKKSVTDYGEMGEMLSSNMTKEWLGEDAVKGMVEQSLNIYPPNPVNAGDKWTKQSSYIVYSAFMGTSKKSTVKSTYSLKEIKNGVAAISMEATVDIGPDGGFEGTLSGTQTGVLLVDTKTGIPTTSDLKLTLKGTVMQQNMQLQMELTADIKTTIKETN